MVVISDGYWNRRYGGDPHVVGNAMASTGSRSRLSASCLAGFEFPDETQAWIPPRHIVPEHPLRPDADATQMRSSHYLGVYARLKPGVSLQTAEAEQRDIFGRLLSVSRRCAEGGCGVQPRAAS